MRLITAFFMTWGCFCAIPCPVRIWDEKARPLMLTCLPLLGLVIGGVWALAALAFSYLPGLGFFGAALLTVLPYLLSGFIHLDGFMDCSDAILSRRDLPERQRILKDSHTGAFAVICVCILMLLSYSLFSTMALERQQLWALVFIPAVVRSCSGIAVDVLQPLGTSGYAGTYREGIEKSHIVAMAATGLVCVGLSLILSGLSGLSAVAAILGSVLTLWYGVRQLGGMSGDISGYAITVGEFCGVLALTFL